MTQKISVKLDEPSPYIEKDSFLYRLKRRLTYLFAFRILRKIYRKDSRLKILEIGTGSGFFLSLAKSYFPFSTFTGIEYDARLIDETVKRASHAKVYQGNAEKFEIDDEFDLIVSFQVIEHLYDPQSMLQCVKRHLKPGGHFLVTTPNLSGIGATFMGSKWHGFREDHVSLKGYSQWESLILDSGFISKYSGSTFFSGIPIMNRLPLGVLNWMLLIIFGSLPWRHGESYVGLFVTEGEANV